MARRVPLIRLVTWGLAACVVFDGALVVAPSAEVFIGLSAAAAAAGTALLLAYPALVALDDRPAQGVVAFAALLHGATIIATLFGAGIVGLPNPRVGLAAFALIDLALLLLVVRSLPAHAALPPKPDHKHGQLARPNHRRTVAAVVAVAIVFELGMNVIRPFFTTYAERGGLELATAALLFLVPSLAALATLPFVARAQARFGPSLLPVALLIGAAGLLLQAATVEPAALVAGRILLGITLALALVEVDGAMYRAVGTEGPGYAGVETARSAALMLAPLLAAASVTVDLALPLAVGGALFVLAAVAAPLLKPSSALEDAHAAAR